MARPVRVVRLNDPIRGSYYIAVVGGIQACGATPREAMRRSEVRHYRDTYDRSGRQIG